MTFQSTEKVTFHIISEEGKGVTFICPSFPAAGR